MPDDLGLSSDFVRGDPTMQSSGGFGAADIGSPDAADYFHGKSYKGILNLSQLRPGRWVTIDITQDDPKQYEVVKVGTEVVQVRDEETKEEFLIPIYKVSLVDLQTPYDDHELDKYSTNPSVRRLTQEKTIEKRKRHEGEPEDLHNRDKDNEKASDSELKSKSNKSDKSKLQQGQGKKKVRGQLSLADKFKARMYPPSSGTRLADNSKLTDQSGTGIRTPRLSHMFGTYRGFLDSNKKPD